MSHRATDRFENWFITSLQTDINDTTTSFRLNKALNVHQGRLVIDPYDETKREIVKVTSVDGNLVYVERGNDNTAPEYHNEGTIVAMHVFAADLNDLYADFAGVVDDMAAAARSVLSPELQFSGGRVGVGKVPASGRKLDVDGDIYSNGDKLLTDSSGSVSSDNLDFSTFGGVAVSSSTSSTSISVTAPSIIMASAVARTATGTSGAYRITFSTSSGTIYKQTTTSTAQDQPYRLMQATGYAYVAPGTYTVARAVSGGVRDNESIACIAFPVVSST